jgi:hypothetical protein
LFDWSEVLEQPQQVSLGNYAQELIIRQTEADKRVGLMIANAITAPIVAIDDVIFVCPFVF